MERTLASCSVITVTDEKYATVLLEIGEGQNLFYEFTIKVTKNTFLIRNDSNNYINETIFVKVQVRLFLIYCIKICLIYSFNVSFPPN